MTDWRDQALCAETDPELFFPEKGGDANPAKRVCRVCDVQAECLAYALTEGPVRGIWGGTTERTRQRIRQALTTQSTTTAALAALVSLTG